LQHASIDHLIAAKIHGPGDEKTEDEHVKDTRDHTTQAAQHVAQADRFSSPGGSDHTRNDNHNNLAKWSVKPYLPKAALINKHLNYVVLILG
jgi:hypothetical protein